MFKGLPVEKFFEELDKLKREAKTDPILRNLGKAAVKILKNRS